MLAVEIFNAAGDKLLETLVGHSLAILYRDGTGTEELHISMDADDLAELRKACERAAKKAVTIRNSLAECPWPTTVIGEDDLG